MIYIISDGSQAKIGCSKHPLKRLKQLQTGHPSLLHILKLYDAPDYAEKRLHYILKSSKTRGKGEWFFIDGSEADFLQLTDLIMQPILDSQAAAHSITPYTPPPTNLPVEELYF